MKICVDYGHGGQDAGAVANNVYEKNINKLIGERVKYHLERHHQTVILTRENDEYVSLDDRVNTINKNKCDIGISIHCNSFTDTSAQGVEIYTWGQGTRETQLAKSVLNNITKAKLYNKNRGIKQAEFRILSPQIPMVLLEVGFISNIQDRNLILDNIENFAVAITKGLLSFYEMQYVGENKDPNKIKQKFYRVQVGYYSHKKNALAMQDYLARMGIESIIKEEV